jgi:hypothetical protein
VAVVTNGLSHLHQPLCQGSFTHISVRPEVLKEFSFRHDAIAMLEKIGQDIKCLGFELTRYARVTQFVALQIEFVVLECVDHPATLLMAGDCQRA